MKVYSIQLPNERAGTYRFVTILILLINCIAFSAVLINAPDKKIKITSALGAVLSLVPIIIFLFNLYLKRVIVYRTEISFILLSILWFLFGKYLFAISVLCFAAIGFYTSKKFKVIFSAEKILYPSFPVKTILWTDTNNVMLKDNVLTIDLKNNKLIQAVIEKGSADEIDEKEFNEFCLQQITAKAQRQ
ncbi:MAG: hypothetical protein ABI741_05610 [Ferruginibacter sp.]